MEFAQAGLQSRELAALDQGYTGPDPSFRWLPQIVNEMALIP